MSNELDKLAAELRKLKPSKNSRASAMETAMSAFSDEFLPETAAAKVNAKNEKKLAVCRPLGGRRCLNLTL